MAAPGKTSRWGSLLQQAVAGVEARLDNILAEGDIPQNNAKALSGSSGAAPAGSPPVTSPGPERSPSTGRKSGKLQDRLAKAVAAKTSATPKSSTSASNLASTTVLSTSGATHEPRFSCESDTPDNAEQVHSELFGHNDQNLQPFELASESRKSYTSEGSPVGTPLKNPSPNGSRDKFPTDGDASLAPEAVGAAAPGNVCSNCDTLNLRLVDLQSTLDKVASQREEETHGYVERIDALESKLQFLSQETTEVARKTASLAPAGSAEKKLAEKDEMIAILMTEGQNLAGTEQKHRAIIKKLRSRIADDEKLTADLSNKLTVAVSELERERGSQSKVNQLEVMLEQSKSTTSELQADLKKQELELTTKDSKISSLESELQRMAGKVELATQEVDSEHQVIGARQIKELEDTVASLRLEKSLQAERARTQAAELRERSERIAEQSRMVELEMQGEMQVLESKLEAMRVLAEEASSGVVGDSQAKLLRQVETLQTQYAVASQNWQGIEASFVARAAGLEKERDAALKRESELRKKARESSARCKQMEEELQVHTTRFQVHQQELEAVQVQLDATEKRAGAAEAALMRARADLQKQRLELRLEEPDLDEQQRRARLGEPLRASSMRSPSLVVSPQRTLSSDLLDLQDSQKARKIPLANGIFEGVTDRPLSSRQSSMQSTTRIVVPSNTTKPQSVLEAPPPESQIDLPPDRPPSSSGVVDALDDLDALSSPQRAIQDMVSVSAVAAGPSIQLVERMSAAVRRLEGEKLAVREELSRISSQRDEARREIVILMRELESGRAAVKRVGELEAEVADINGRYQTTLEMLGEKSELVDELRADVADVKAMYRELVERTVR